jgi:hypothetical protein
MKILLRAEVGLEPDVRRDRRIDEDRAAAQLFRKMRGVVAAKRAAEERDAMRA